MGNMRGFEGRGRWIITKSVGRKITQKLRALVTIDVSWIEFPAAM